MIKKDRYKTSKFKWYRLQASLLRIAYNLTIISGFVGLVWYGYNVFMHKVDPLVGALLFLLGLAAFIVLIRYMPRRYRRIAPSFKLTTFAVLCIVVVFTFAGVQPLAGYKSTMVQSLVDKKDEWDAGAEERQTEREQKADEKAQQVAVEERQSLEDIEREVVGLVNTIRVERGSKPLQWDDELYVYAKRHSVAMASRGELFHTPVGKPYAENCWGGEGSKYWDAGDIVESWLTSPPHRTWLLCPNLKHIAMGIAYSDNGMYASWTFWVDEPKRSDWWYSNDGEPPAWWY